MTNFYPIHEELPTSLEKKNKKREEKDLAPYERCGGVLMPPEAGGYSLPGHLYCTRCCRFITCGAGEIAQAREAMRGERSGRVEWDKLQAPPRRSRRKREKKETMLMFERVTLGLPPPAVVAEKRRAKKRQAGAAA